jgi:hypothetical protein
MEWATMNVWYSSIVKTLNINIIGALASMVNTISPSSTVKRHGSKTRSTIRKAMAKNISTKKSM